MNKLLLVSLSLMAILSLGGCKNKGKDKSGQESGGSSEQKTTCTLEEFKERLNANDASFGEEENPKLKNISYKSGTVLSLHPVNYKEGEFYDSQEGLGGRRSIWKDSDGFHKYVKTLFGGETYSELTEEQFEAEMASGKQTVHSIVYTPIQMAKELIAEKEGGESERRISFKFSVSILGNYRMEATVVFTEKDYEENIVEHTDVYTISLGEDLPYQYQYDRDDSNQTAHTFQYGNASFDRP